MEAPVSTLLFEGRKQDLAFEKPVGQSADRRHHVRFWLVLAERRGGKACLAWRGEFRRRRRLEPRYRPDRPHIAPDVDADRDLVIGDLAKAGMLVSTYQVSGVGPTLNGRNGGGDRYYTDGEVTIGVLSPSAARTREVPAMLPSPTATGLKRKVWSLGLEIRDLLR